MWWRYLMLILTGMTLAAMVYLTSRFYKFAWTAKMSGGRRWLRVLVSAGSSILVLGLFGLKLGVFSAVVALLHLVVIWALCDLVFFLIKKYRKTDFQRYWAGMTAVAVTAVYLGVGWVLAHNVWGTHYTLATPKAVGSLRVGLVADAHVGTTFDGAGFARWMEKLQSEEPDVVVIAGDFVDDDTSLADMRAACAALGSLDAPLGVYYVYGNHDKGYFDNSIRGYDGDDLAAALEQNGVTVLQDETVRLTDGFYLMGRKDRSEEFKGGRRSMDELVGALDGARTQDLLPDQYIIVADHQPQDYDHQARAGVDLVLSGHTHGGWLFPVNVINRYAGNDDLVYGHERRDNTDFIVTSGISDWSLQFRTGCKSEYVIVDIQGQ